MSVTLNYDNDNARNFYIGKLNIKEEKNIIQVRGL